MHHCSINRIEEMVERRLCWRIHFHGDSLHWAWAVWSESHCGGQAGFWAGVTKSIYLHSLHSCQDGVVKTGWKAKLEQACSSLPVTDVWVNPKYCSHNIIPVLLWKHHVSKPMCSWSLHEMDMMRFNSEPIHIKILGWWYSTRTILAHLEWYDMLWFND